MADSKRKKIMGNVTKLNLFFSRIYRKYVILTWKTNCNLSNFIYIYNFREIMVKYEFSHKFNYMTSHWRHITSWWQKNYT